MEGDRPVYHDEEDQKDLWYASNWQKEPAWVISDAGDRGSMYCSSRPTEAAFPHLADWATDSPGMTVTANAGPAATDGPTLEQIEDQTHFVDDDFPARQESIGNDMPCAWVRAPHLMQEPKLFSGVHQNSVIKE